MHRGHPKRHGPYLCCARKSVESIGTHERNEVTETQGFSLVFTARPHISFTIWLIGFFPSTRFGMSSRRSLREGTGALGDPYHLPVGTRGHASANAEMNGRFVLTSRVSPPQGRTVMVRSGGLVFSAKLRRFGGWTLIYGSGETSMPNLYNKYLRENTKKSLDNPIFILISPRLANREDHR